MVSPVALNFEDSTELGPLDRIKIGNSIAMRTALDAPIRGLAGQLLSRCRNIPKHGGQIVQKWIRDKRNFTYLMESPSVELLQGPYTSLYNRVLDCDCAAILWTALTRSAGLRTFMVGIGRIDEFPNLVHAVGWDADQGKHFELVDDRAYKQGLFQPKCFEKPPGFFGLAWSNEPGIQSYLISIGPDDPFRPVNRSELAMLMRQSAGGVMGFDPKAQQVPVSEYSTDDPAATPWWQDFLSQIVESAGGVATAAWAPAGYIAPGADVTYYQDDADQAAVEARLRQLEAEKGGIPTALWVVGAIVLAGGVVYLITRR